MRGNYEERTKKAEEFYFSNVRSFIYPTAIDASFLAKVASYQQYIFLQEPEPDIKTSDRLDSNLLLFHTSLKLF